jgi:hypothetical protein
VGLHPGIALARGLSKEERQSLIYGTTESNTLPNS